MAYNINIVNGTGTENVLTGSYGVTAEVTGYNNSSISPSTVNITADESTYNFTVAAEGILTLHVTETGTTDGTPIVGATFYRTDASGNEYGSAITTNELGNAVFENVPFAETGAPTIYFKQTSSDGAHEFDSTVQSTTLESTTITLEITNAAPQQKTITLTDANYANLPIASGTIYLS